MFSAWFEYAAMSKEAIEQDCPGSNGVMATRIKMTSRKLQRNRSRAHKPRRKKYFERPHFRK